MLQLLPCSFPLFAVARGAAWNSSSLASRGGAAPSSPAATSPSSPPSGVPTTAFLHSSNAVSTAARIGAHNASAVNQKSASNTTTTTFAANPAHSFPSHANAKTLGEGDRVPAVTFHVREKFIDNPADKENGYHTEWRIKTSDDYFKGRRVVLFGLPGAFTPTCTSKHLPQYENLYDSLKQHGIAEVYCLAPNDSFVMNAWKEHLKIEKVQFIPDGDLDFTRKMKMDVWKSNLGFGLRTWRYSMVVDDGTIEKLFIEDGRRDDAEDDPYAVSDAATMLGYLKAASGSVKK